MTIVPKNGGWIVPSMVNGGAKYLHEFSQTVERSAKHTAELNMLKQQAFYTDCVDDGTWSEPDKIIDAGLAQSLITIAQMLKAKQEIGVKELELWQEMVIPYRKTTELPHAVYRWYMAIYELGLSAIPPEKCKRFLFGEPGTGEWVLRPEKA